MVPWYARRASLPQTPAQHCTRWADQGLFLEYTAHMHILQHRGTIALVAKRKTVRSACAQDQKYASPCVW